MTLGSLNTLRAAHRIVVSEPSKSIDAFEHLRADAASQSARFLLQRKNTICSKYRLNDSTYSCSIADKKIEGNDHAQINAVADPLRSLGFLVAASHPCALAGLSERRAAALSSEA
jgi:hypothetical protein